MDRQPYRQGCGEERVQSSWANDCEENNVNQQERDLSGENGCEGLGEEWEERGGNEREGYRRTDSEGNESADYYPSASHQHQDVAFIPQPQAVGLMASHHQGESYNPGEQQHYNTGYGAALGHQGYPNPPGQPNLGYNPIIQRQENVRYVGQYNQEYHNPSGPQNTSMVGYNPIHQNPYNMAYGGGYNQGYPIPPGQQILGCNPITQGQYNVGHGTCGYPNTNAPQNSSLGDYNPAQPGPHYTGSGARQANQVYPWQSSLPVFGYDSSQPSQHLTIPPGPVNTEHVPQFPPYHDQASIPSQPPYGNPRPTRRQPRAKPKIPSMKDQRLQSEIERQRNRVANNYTRRRRNDYNKHIDRLHEAAMLLEREGMISTDQVNQLAPENRDDWFPPDDLLVKEKKAKQRATGAATDEESQNESTEGDEENESRDGDSNGPLGR